jgi:hypothetical protein
LTDIATVTLLVTANLKGDLVLLPRLFTLIQRERRAAHGPVFLLDLGDTCALEAWVCRATQGRAPLIVLDGMGYDAALLGGPEGISIPVPSLQQLLGTVMMRFVVWGRVATLTKRGITLALASGDAVLPADHPGIRVDRSTGTLPASGEPGVTLGDVAQGSIARVEMVWPEWTVQEARLVSVQSDTPPDPTIGAIVEFVENEARHYAQS